MRVPTKSDGYPCQTRVRPRRSPVAGDAVAPRGVLCAETAHGFEHRIQMSIDAGEEHLVIDLGEVTLLTAAGINAMVAARARLHRGGGTLTIRNARGVVKRVLEITGLDTSAEVQSTATERAGQNQR